MTAESDSTCKIDRVSEKWELATIDDQLRTRWADGDSLRDLETYYNEAVLRSAMESEGMDALDGEVSNVYRLLTDEDVSPGKQIDAESRLRQSGIDPTELTDDFVSYQTVRTHLNDCLGLETARETSLTIDEARTTVLKLISRTESVATQMIGRLETDDELRISAPTVTLSLRVGCADCDDEYTFSTLLERGGCSCETSTQ